jgi:putative oxidoreductase
MKARKIALYVLIGLGALQFCAIGFLKTVGPFIGIDMFIKSMGRLHYDHTWTFLIGMIDLLGGIGLLFKKYRPYAALGIVLLMHGAIGSHATAGDAFVGTLLGPGFAAIIMTIILLLERPLIISRNPNQMFADKN